LKRCFLALSFAYLVVIKKERVVYAMLRIAFRSLCGGRGGRKKFLWVVGCGTVVYTTMIVDCVAWFRWCWMLWKKKEVEKEFEMVY